MDPIVLVFVVGVLFALALLFGAFSDIGKRRGSQKAYHAGFMDGTRGRRRPPPRKGNRRR